MSIKVLLDRENDIIIKVDIGNLPAKFIRFHVHDEVFYMKDVGMSIPHEAMRKATEVRESTDAFRKWKERLR